MTAVAAKSEEQAKKLDESTASSPALTPAAVTDNKSESQEKGKNSTSSETEATAAEECATTKEQTETEQPCDGPLTGTEAASIMPDKTSVADADMDGDNTATASNGKQDSSQSQDSDETASDVSLTAAASVQTEQKESHPSIQTPSASVSTASSSDISKNTGNHKSSNGIGKFIVLCVIIMLTAGVGGYLFSQDILPLKNTKKEPPVFSQPIVSRSDASQQATDSSETQTPAETTVSTTTAPPTTTATTAAPVYQTLKKGDKNADVKKMQKRLCKLGYMDEESCTGYFGPFTELRVKMFQKKAGLSQTGIADSDTLTHLYADDAPKCI